MKTKTLILIGAVIAIILSIFIFYSFSLRGTNDASDIMNNNHQSGKESTICTIDAECEDENMIETEMKGKILIASYNFSGYDMKQFLLKL